MRRPHIAVVGAGPSGLATTIALTRLGIRVTLFERSSEPRLDGGPIWLYSNAVSVLEKWGLRDAVFDQAAVVTRHSFRNWNGDLYWLFPLEELARDHPEPLIVIGRDQLAAILLSAVDPALLRHDVTCTGFVATSDGVRLLRTGYHAGDGEVFDGLVGTDGVRSIIRRQLLGDEELVSDFVAWTGFAQTDDRRWPYPFGESITVFGQGRLLSAATMDRRAGEPADLRRVYWVATEGGPDADRPLDRRPDTGDAARRFHPTVVSLIESSGRLVAFPVRDRAPSSVWGRGRVTLLGDAAHPMMPAAGQGTCQAIEGAYVLGRCLETCNTVPRAFRAYELRRQERTARVTRFSRLITELMLLEAPTFVRRIGMRLSSSLVVDEYRYVLDVEPAARTALLRPHPPAHPAPGGAGRLSRPVIPAAGAPGSRKGPRR